MRAKADVTRICRRPVLVTVLALCLSQVPAPPVQSQERAPAAIGSASGQDALDALYRGGIDFASFAESATRRQDTWRANYARGLVPRETVERARGIAGQWRLLVVAEDWCGDSANTIPYVARLVDAVDGLDMRIINSAVGKDVMAAHPTPDGRPATPTVVLLAEDGTESGCFVERPSSLQTWFLDNEGVLPERELYAQKYAWYDEDRGHETVAEIVEMIEAAAGGRVICAPLLEYRD